MSGFEIAGLIIGTIPLVVNAVEAYIGFMKDWGKTASELRSINRQLTTERAKLYNILEQLLGDIVSQQDVEPMLKDPFGPSWKAEQANTGIRRRLWDSYDPFEHTVLEVRDALAGVMDRLEVETISKGISDLGDLTRQSVELEPKRRKRSRAKVVNIWRDLSTSIHRAFRSSILCKDSHLVTVLLGPQFMDIGHEDDDEKILHQIHFTVAMSFELHDNSATRNFWDEVNIKTALNPILTGSCTPPPATSTPDKTTRQKMVSFATKETWKSITSFSSNSSASNKSPSQAVVAALSHHTSNISLAGSPSDIVVESTGLHLDLCLTLKMAREVRPDCYGQLVDTQDTKRHFKIYPTETTAPNSDTWSIIALYDLLAGNKGAPPLVGLEAKVRLALAIASSVLQLSKTPWLPESLTSQNVHFFDRAGICSYDHPFLLRTFPEPVP